MKWRKALVMIAEVPKRKEARRYMYYYAVAEVHDLFGLQLAKRVENRTVRPFGRPRISFSTS